jgi:uncharacterized protein (DUF924 family)
MLAGKRTSTLVSLLTPFLSSFIRNSYTMASFAEYSLLNLPPNFGARIYKAWFGENDPLETLEMADIAKTFFNKNDALDDRICMEFGDFLEHSIRQISHTKNIESLMNPDLSLQDKYGLILLLDQFTRNLYRHNPKFIQGDALALLYAKHMVKNGLDKAFSLRHRFFIYLPFEHSEVLKDQYESIRLYEAALNEAPQDDVCKEFLKFAKLHLNDILMFGRFPYRNDILGRKSTPEELDYLKERG